LTWICLVEDEPDVRDAITDALRSAGHGVQSFQNGTEALAAIDTALEPPRLVILDLLLPGLSGKDVLRRIRTGRRVPEVPVLVITGTDEDEDYLSPWPVVAVLRKPVLLDTLVAAVEKALPRRRRKPLTKSPPK
jgi:DNA-binding response OmpR family regulator